MLVIYLTIPSTTAACNCELLYTQVICLPGARAGAAVGVGVEAYGLTGLSGAFSALSADMIG